ncbi:urease subunit beta [Herbiconiux moechotypicola]|uniref:urease n=1 Tax=Herbiconiux moechotypicola TaxID=637393 RepID=A0ABN3DA28_9MICO|nr:urease subunit beta [Herbiconiux moechotypicola]MCS5729012.1 urease subunit beta [Herbiconiux moechotypicola]
MNLSPTELDRLTIFTAAEFARRNLRLGILLSHPEAVAYLTDEAMLLARQDVPFAEIRDRVSRMLTPEQLQEGVASMIPLVMIELPMAEGTKLLAVYDPVPPGRDEFRPGEVITPGEAREMFDDASLLELEVVNRGDRDVQVRSLTHFFEVNRALDFDREQAYGMRLAVPAGQGQRFEPGIPKRVLLTPIGGERVVLGQAGLVNGALDDSEVRERAFAAARERGYLAAASADSAADNAAAAAAAAESEETR